MNDGLETKDLLVLTADSHMQSTVGALLRHRRLSLGITDIEFDVIRHPDSDPGCRTASEKLLGPLRGQYRKAMVLFDFEGCGSPNTLPTSLELALEGRYYNAGWTLDSVAFVVIAPELETWMFGTSYRALERLVRWPPGEPIRGWFESRGYLRPGETKPEDPKAAIGAVLRMQRTQVSAKLFGELAQTVSLAHCQDRAFQKFRSTLQRWFPAQ